jgi:hypothetical protein
MERPTKLTIESKPPEKSPYTKVFNVIDFLLTDILECCREI